MKLKEKVYKKNKIYNGKAINFCKDDIILPNGNKAIREYIDHPGAVAIVPFINISGRQNNLRNSGRKTR